MFRYDVNGKVMYTLYVMGDVNIMEKKKKKKSCWECHGYLGYGEI